MLGSVGAASNPDVNADVEIRFGSTLLTGLEAGSEVQPTQPPHPPLNIDIPSGYPNVSGTTVGDSDTPDIANISDFSVRVTPLVPTSISATGGAFTRTIRNPSLVPAARRQTVPEMIVVTSRFTF